LDAPDFSSYLARAQQSKANAIGLANAGADMTNTITKAKNLGMIPGPQTFAAMSLRITVVDALGLETAQGLTLSESFYWDLDDASRRGVPAAVAIKMPAGEEMTLTAKRP